MIIKKFQGKTEAEAVESAKKELGNGVVIMNVRNVKRKGIFSFLMPQLTEVTVALEEEPMRVPPAVAAAKEEIKQQPLVNAIAKGAREVSPDSASVVPGQTVSEDVKQESSAIAEKLDSLHSLLEQQLQKPDREEESKADEKEETSELERFMKLLYNTMLDNEVNEQYANQIIDEIEKINKPNMPFDYALANTYQRMILKFGNPAGIAPAQKGPKVVFFVGPTGVGKTTTIAKIASKFSVPFHVIYSTEEMEQALKDFRDYDYILVDTAGHSHHNEAQKEVMNAFLHSVDGLAEKEVFLVLSATTKYRDLLSIADTYSAMTEYKLIFTKLDETTTLGNLLNLKLHTGAALSYVTCGQNVPDDIEVFNPQRTVKQLLGGGKN